MYIYIVVLESSMLHAKFHGFMARHVRVHIGPPGSNWCFSFAPELVGYSAPRDLHRRAAYSICESLFLIHGSPALEKIFKGFYHIWAWRPSWSCDLDYLSHR